MESSDYQRYDSDLELNSSYPQHTHCSFHILHIEDCSYKAATPYKQTNKHVISSEMI